MHSREFHSCGTVLCEAVVLLARTADRVKTSKCGAEKYSTWERGYATDSVPNNILLALHALVKFLMRKQDEMMFHRERTLYKDFQRDWLACEADAAPYKSLVGKMTDCIRIFKFAIHRKSY